MNNTETSIDNRKHPYTKKDFKGTEKTREVLDNIRTSRKTLPLMSNEDFYSFCQVRRILLEQPYLTRNSYSKAMKSYMNGWLKEIKSLKG